MNRALGTCSEPGCPDAPVYRGRCYLHTRWNPPTPRQRGRALMARRRRIMRNRGPYCQQCGGHGPLELHHKDGDVSNDRLDNLELLCGACHLAATLLER